jgi:hypothetical protein
MKLYDRITLCMVILAVIALILLPTAIAQIPGPGGPRGGGGDRAGRGGGRGDMDMGPSGTMPGRGGGGGRGGGPGTWMNREELTDTQIDLILKAYSNRDPDEAKKLQEQRKDMTREAFIQTLVSPTHAWSEYFQIMSDESRYTPILVWCEKWVADEAKGIRELKKDNYDLYKKKLDALENKYRSIIYMRDATDELIPVLVKNLQLGLKQNELVFQIWTAENQDKKESLTASLKEVVTEIYYLNIQRRTIELKEIQNRIESMQKYLKDQMSQIEIQKDPNVAKEEIQSRIDRLVNPTDFFGGFYRGGRPGRGGRGMPQFYRTDGNDPNSKPSH